MERESVKSLLSTMCDRLPMQEAGVCQRLGHHILHKKLNSCCCTLYSPLTMYLKLSAVSMQPPMAWIALHVQRLVLEVGAVLIDCPQCPGEGNRMINGASS